MNPIRFEHADVVIVDQSPIGLDIVAAVLLESPRPELFYILFGYQQRFTAEQREWPAAVLDTRFHFFQVVGVEHVPGISLRVLVAILALNITLYPQRPKFYAHIFIFSFVEK